MKTSVTQGRVQATNYELLCAISEAVAQDFDQLEKRVELLESMADAWLDIPAFTRRHSANATLASDLGIELDRCREELADARRKSWTLRVAGYHAGRMFIAEA